MLRTHINRILFFISGLMVMNACIKDDFVFDEVDPMLRITSTIDTIAIDSTYQFDYQYLDNVGMSQEVNVMWCSSDTSIISISDSGLAEAHMSGSAFIKVKYMDGAETLVDSLEVFGGDSTVSGPASRSGVIATTSTYLLTGDFIITQVGADLHLDISSNYAASSVLPGLFVYLSNNPATTVGAYEIGAVTVFNGAHQYIIPNTGLNDYNYVLYFCKPFNVKVGDGPMNP